MKIQLHSWISEKKEGSITITMNDVGEKDNIIPQDQTNTMETDNTETDAMENSIMSDRTSDSKEEVHTSELFPIEEEYIGILITEIQTVNHRLDTMTNLCIVGMIGIGLIAGILASNILARYFIS